MIGAVGLVHFCFNSGTHFSILPGNAESVVRIGGKIGHLLIANLLSNISAKKLF